MRVDGAAPTYLIGGPPGALLALLGKSRLALLEPATGRVRWRSTFGADLGWTLVDGAALWVQFSGGEAAHLVRVDVESGRRLGQVDLPEPGVAGMAKVGDDLWVATPGGRIPLVVR